jgi:heme/copper-type cytochrome/quinol oxidase subunit 1
MTPTQTTTQPRPEVVIRELRPRRSEWIERATSADHKSVALLYIATSLIFIALAATEFALMRMQLLVPENNLLEPEIFNRLMTASVASFLYLGVIPLICGLIGYIVPLQIGARGVALPRLNQLSYWLYVAGAVTIQATFLYAVPETGTIALPPLSEETFSPSHGVDAWIVGVGLACLGFTCFAINMIVTLRRMHAPGLVWRRMPAFASAATVISYVLLAIGPIMFAALSMLLIDRQFDGIYIVLTGLYLTVFLAAAGTVSEILPTFARKPLFSRRAVSTSFIAVAGLGLLAWMQNMYIAPLNKGWTIAAMLFAIALLVPIGTLFYNWIATIWNGALELRAATWYALLAISTMACGLAGELMYSVIPVGWMLDNTTASQGDTLYVLVGGGVMGSFAALHYWFPKMSGRLLGETLGKAALAAMTVGIHLYVLPMFLAGLKGQPVDVFKFYESMGVDGLNVIASIGAFILVIGILLELGNLAYSWNNGISARGHDPWRGSTLEWYALSPPPPHNFDAVPDVRSAEPLRDIRDAIARRQRSFTPPAPLERIASPEPEREPEPEPEPEAEAAPEAAAEAAPESQPEAPADAAESPDDGDNPPVA